MIFDDFSSLHIHFTHYQCGVRTFWDQILNVKVVCYQSRTLYVQYNPNIRNSIFWPLHFLNLKIWPLHFNFIKKKINWRMSVTLLFIVFKFPCSNSQSLSRTIILYISITSTVFNWHHCNSKFIYWIFHWIFHWILLDFY